MEFLDNRVELWLLGRYESRDFENECKSLRGWECVNYLGQKPLEEVYQHIGVSDIGVSILYPWGNYLTSLPTKIFEYMAHGLPVVISDFKYWREFFKGCAVFVAPGSPESISKSIKYLMDNPQRAHQLGEAGRKLSEEEYNWEKEKNKLLKVYEELCDDHSFMQI